MDYDIIDLKTFKDLTFKNIRELTFQTDEAAFLAGYLAAGTTKTGVVATYGGVLFPTVTIFMNGFSAGVRAYNKDQGTDVQVLGWNPEKQEGTQVSPDPAVGFDNSAEGRRITEDFIAEGALARSRRQRMPVTSPSSGSTSTAASPCPTRAACSSRAWRSTWMSRSSKR